jgi:hypothetical protein
VVEAWLGGRNAATTRRDLSYICHFAEWFKAPSAPAAVDALLRLGHGAAIRVVMNYKAY